MVVVVVDARGSLFTGQYFNQGMGLSKFHFHFLIYKSISVLHVSLVIWGCPDLACVHETHLRFHLQ